MCFQNLSTYLTINNAFKIILIFIVCTLYFIASTYRYSVTHLWKQDEYSKNVITS